MGSEYTTDEYGLIKFPDGTAACAYSSVSAAKLTAELNRLAAERDEWAAKHRKELGNVDWLSEEWRRLRKTLNAIAWSADMSLKQATELARDTLAIGSKVCNERATAALTMNWPEPRPADDESVPGKE